jgi:hypothetical protein
MHASGEQGAALNRRLSERLGLTPLALEAMQPTHEGDAANNQMLYTLIDQACPLAYELVCAMDELLACLELAPENMRRNVAFSGQAMAVAARGADRPLRAGLSAPVPTAALPGRSMPSTALFLRLSIRLTERVPGRHRGLPARRRP